MDIRNDLQLSLDFEAQTKAHADDAVSARGWPLLQLVHSSNAPIKPSSEKLRGNKIIEGIRSHAKSLSW